MSEHNVAGDDPDSEAASATPAPSRARERVDDAEVDEEGRESFPASDPPANSGTT